MCGWHSDENEACPLQAELIARKREPLNRHLSLIGVCVCVLKADSDWSSAELSAVVRALSLFCEAIFVLMSCCFVGLKFRLACTSFRAQVHMASVRELLPNRTNAELMQLVTSAHFIECVDTYKASRARQRAPIPSAAGANVAAAASATAASSDVPIVDIKPPKNQGTKRLASAAYVVTPAEFRQRVCERMDHQIMLGKTKAATAKWVSRRLETTSLKLTPIADYDAKVGRAQLKAAHLHLLYLDNKRARKGKGGDEEDGGDEDDDDGED